MLYKRDRFLFQSVLHCLMKLRIMEFQTAQVQNVKKEPPESINSDAQTLVAPHLLSQGCTAQQASAGRAAPA